MREAVEPVGTPHGHADAGDGERIADADLFVTAGKSGRYDARRRGLAELKEGDVGGGEMREQTLDVELRMTRGTHHVLERWHLAGYGIGKLVASVRLYAVPRREQKVACNRGRGAKG